MNEKGCNIISEPDSCYTSFIQEDVGFGNEIINLMSEKKIDIMTRKNEKNRNNNIIAYIYDHFCNGNDTNGTRFFLDQDDGNIIFPKNVYDEVLEIDEMNDKDVTKEK